MGSVMNVACLEEFLARLYTDLAYRHAFLDHPEEALACSALTMEERAACMAMNRHQLITAARAYDAKRAAQRRPRLPHK